MLTKLANLGGYLKKAIRTLISREYSAAFNKATKIYTANLKGPNAKKKNFGVEAIMNKINAEELFGDHNKKLKKLAIIDAVASGYIGVLPLKKGCPQTI